MDITVVLNAHREGALASATISSLEASLASARASGVHAEVIVVLDNADEATVKFIGERAPNSWRIESTSHSDLGLARNHAVALAAGRFVAFLDADDLFGENWLVSAFRAAQADTRRIVWHPEVNVYFGAARKIFLHADMDDPRFDLADLMCVNQWTALAFAPANLLREVPYRAIDLQRQIGYEDWAWNEAVILAGALHKTVAGTAHFIRVKSQGSLVARSNLGRSMALPAGLLGKMRQRRGQSEGS